MRISKLSSYGLENEHRSNRMKTSFLVASHLIFFLMVLNTKIKRQRIKTFGVKKNRCRFRENQNNEVSECTFAKLPSPAISRKSCGHKGERTSKPVPKS